VPNKTCSVKEEFEYELYIERGRDESEDYAIEIEVRDGIVIKFRIGYAVTVRGFSEFKVDIVGKELTETEAKIFEVSADTAKKLLEIGKVVVDSYSTTTICKDKEKEDNDSD